jgi:hypothetical protein
MEAVRKLIREISTVDDCAEMDIAALCNDAMREVKAVETTFSEIAKLQQRILGDSKTIGGTAHNTGSPKLPPDIIESTSPCAYCTQGGKVDCSKCGIQKYEYLFQGRQLRADA